MINRYHIQYTDSGASKVTGNMTKMGVAGKGAGTAMMGMKTAMVALAGAYVGLQGLKQTISVIREFDTTMLEVQAVTNATAQEFDMLSEAARKMGATTRFSASESGQAILALSRAGFDTQESMAALGDTLNLAIAGVIGIQEASDLAAITIRQFGLEASEANRVSDVLVTTANNSAQTVGDLAESMKYAGVVAGTMGVSLEDTAATLGILANAGIRGSMAGTTMRKVLLSLSAPTSSANKALADLGLTFDDISLKNNTVAQAFKKLNDAGMDAGAAQQIFSTRALSGALALAKYNDKISDFVKLNKDATGAAKSAAETMDSGLNASFLKLKSVTEELMLSLGDAGFTSVISGVIKGITLLMQGVNGLVNMFDETKRVMSPARLDFEKLALVVETLGKKTNRTKEQQIAYSDAISTMQSEYPKLFSNIDSQKTKYEAVNTALEAQRDLIIQNMALEMQKEELSALAKEQIALQIKEKDISDQLLASKATENVMSKELEGSRALAIKSIKAENEARQAIRDSYKTDMIDDYTAAQLASISNLKLQESVNYNLKDSFMKLDDQREVSLGLSNELDEIQIQQNENAKKAEEVTSKYTAALMGLIGAKKGNNNADKDTIANQELFKGFLPGTSIVSTSSLIPQETLDNTTENIKTFAQENSDTMDIFSSNISKSLGDMFTGVEGSFASFLNSVTSQIIRMMTSKAVTSFMSMLSGLGSGGGNGLDAALSGLSASGGFGASLGAGSIGMFALGGEYKAGVPRMTGEYGTEIDVPSVNGRVLSRNDAMNAVNGGGQPSVNKFIFLSDPNELTQELQTTANERVIVQTMQKYGRG